MAEHDVPFRTSRSPVLLDDGRFDRLADFGLFPYFKSENRTLPA
jgi:hypothetical protein